MDKKIYAVADQKFEVKAHGNNGDVYVNGRLGGYKSRYDMYAGTITKSSMEKDTKKEIIGVIREYNKGHVDANKELLALLVGVDYD